MTKHTAKRKAAGWYEYRGWDVERSEAGDHWNLTPPNSEDMTDATATLSEARALIDRQSQ
jgi:hypothetical protein